MPLLPLAILAINGLALLVDLVVLANARAKALFFRFPVVVQKLFVGVVVGPLFVAPLLPQDRVPLPATVALPAGLVLLGTGIGLILAAFTRIGVVPSLRKQSDLVTTGVYAVVRHPIYAGTLIAALGWGILLRCGLLLGYFPLLCLLYLALIGLEERGLLAEYGDEYRRYRQRVPNRLVPFLF